jgi:hypothetical protein
MEIEVRKLHFSPDFISFLCRLILALSKDGLYAKFSGSRLLPNNFEDLSQSRIRSWFLQTILNCPMWVEREALE